MKPRRNYQSRRGRVRKVNTQSQQPAQSQLSNNQQLIILLLVAVIQLIAATSLALLLHGRAEVAIKVALLHPSVSDQIRRVQTAALNRQYSYATTHLTAQSGLPIPKVHSNGCNSRLAGHLRQKWLRQVSSLPQLFRGLERGNSKRAYHAILTSVPIAVHLRRRRRRHRRRLSRRQVQAAGDRARKLARYADNAARRRKSQ